MEEKDLRGLDLRADNFYNQLLSLISSSGVQISTALFILKDVVNELQQTYNRVVAQQYNDFCEKANEEIEEKESAKDEAEQTK